MTDPTEILRDGADTYESKNEDYGDSWRHIGQVFELLADGDTVELETAEDFVAMGLLTRRMDKIARSFFAELVNDEVNHEPAVDAHEDEMVYAAMSAANERDREHEELKSDEDPLPEPGGDEQISIISEDADNYDSVLEALRENAAKDQYGSR